MATDGKYNLLNEEKVRSAARFAADFAMAPETYPQFSDTMPNADITPLVKAMLRLRCGFDFYAAPKPGRLNYRQSNNIVSSMIWYSVYQDLQKHPAEAAVSRTLPPYHYFKDAGVIISRAAPGDDNAISLAVKAGNNGELHNHNDVGSFDVALGRLHIVGDCGAPEYNLAPDRYASDLHGSQGHPVPRVADTVQSAGKKYHGSFIASRFTDTDMEAVIDLKPAYKVKGLMSLTRTIRHDRLARKVEIIDQVEFDTPQLFGGALPSYQPIQNLGGGIFTFGIRPAALRLSVSSDDGKLSFKTAPVNCVRRKKFDERAAKVDYVLEKPVKKAKVTITITMEENK